MIAWFARNPVAANLLMVGVVVTGVVVGQGVRQEVFPTFVLDTVEVRLEYRGASPEEVERAVVRPIEAELRGMDLVRRVLATATEGQAEMVVEITPGFDRNRALQEVTAAVQRLRVLPADVEPPVIGLGLGRRRGVMSVAVYGDLDERALVDFAQQLEEGLLAEPEVSVVEIEGARRPELQVEVPLARLRALGLTLGEVAERIREAALDVPAGTLRTPGGDLLLQTSERRATASAFADLLLVGGREGARVRLGDVARIRDGFEEAQREAWFDGRPAVFLDVYSTETQAPLDVAAAVRRFVERERASLPDSVGLTLYRDRSDNYRGRVKLLMENGAVGLLLVLLALALLLELRVAFWTAVGIPISILGSLALLPLMGASINMISLFGFIVTLGIVVDDAVVVGEDIFHNLSEGMGALEAAVVGARRMAVPVVFAVGTNIIAFLPLLFVPGETGLFFQVLPAVVIAVFTVSLAECLLILPAHLAHGRSHAPGWVQEAQRRVRTTLERWLEAAYVPLLDASLRHRALTISVFVAFLAVVSAWLASGRVPFAFRPTIETDFVQAEVELPSGTPAHRTREVAFAVEAAARRALEGAGQARHLIGIFTEVGKGGSHVGEVSVMLAPQSERELGGGEFADLWRAEVPAIPDLESLFFDYLVGPGGSAEVDVQLGHPDVGTLRAAAAEVAEAIGRYPGVADVRRGFGREMPRLDFELTPAARSLGITAAELGRQVRDAFHGAEALRQPRQREEQRVVVRLPPEERRSLASLDALLVRAPGGGELPLREAARVRRGSAPVRINRVDGGRVVNVTANVVRGATTGNRVLAAFAERELPAIQERFPGLRVTFEGEQREQRDALAQLGWGLVAALLVVYAVLAALLHSYGQAILVMLTIPWSLAGAVVGHLLLGFGLSVFSLFGGIALCGMVVNGAFVLALTRGDLLAAGASPADATRGAAIRRLRPILLTAMTTFLGLGPMILETSMQALFLVPMAVALGVGTLFSAVVTLVLLPAIYAVRDART